MVMLKSFHPSHIAWTEVCADGVVDKYIYRGHCFLNLSCILKLYGEIIHSLSLCVCACVCVSERVMSRGVTARTQASLPWHR